MSMGIDNQSAEHGRPLLEFVLGELQDRMGTWLQISKAMDPDNWRRHYSWLTKLAQGKIPDPSVNKIQRLADHFRNIQR